MEEIREGIFHWRAPHPDWKPGEDWDELVSSYAIDDGERLLVFDPLGLPAEIERLASKRSVSVLVTCLWHERDAVRVAQQFGATLHIPPPDDAHPTPTGALLYRAGDRLPGGVEAYVGMEDTDLVLWMPSRGALIAGDSLVDRGKGLEVPADWVEDMTSRAQVLEALRPLLDLPVEMVLPTHGNPVGADALRRALS